MQQELPKWWDGRAFWAFALLAAAVPLLWPTVPPLIDLPSHMASYHIALDNGTAPGLRRFYSFEWHLIGNLGVDLLIIPIGHLFGVELGTKIIVMAIPVLTVAGFLATAREVHGRVPPTAAFALPFAYPYALLFGFVNYCLAMALALLAFALWLRWGTLRKLRTRAAVFVLFSCVIWLCHALGWALFALMCGVAELQRNLAARDQSVVQSFFRTGVACLPLLAPVALMALAPSAGPATVSGWLDVKELGKWVIALLRDRWMILDIAAAAVVGGVIAVAALGWGRLRMAPVLAATAGALALAYLLLPKAVANSDFINSRIIPYAAALAILAIRPIADNRLARRWAIAATLFALVKIGSLTGSFFLYDRSYQRNLEALDHIPSESAIAVFTPFGCTTGLGGWMNPRTGHLPGMATVRENSFVNLLWTLQGLHLLETRLPNVGRYSSDPSQLVAARDCVGSYLPPLSDALKSLPTDTFQYVWLIDFPRSDWPHDRNLQAIWNAENAVVYRIMPTKP
jgi:hypothetical protein